MRKYLSFFKTQIYMICSRGFVRYKVSVAYYLDKWCLKFYGNGIDKMEASIHNIAMYFNLFLQYAILLLFLFVTTLYSEDMPNYRTLGTRVYFLCSQLSSILAPSFPQYYPYCRIYVSLHILVRMCLENVGVGR